MRILFFHNNYYSLVLWYLQLTTVHLCQPNEFSGSPRAGSKLGFVHQLSRQELNCQSGLLEMPTQGNFLASAKIIQIDLRQSLPSDSQPLLSRRVKYRLRYYGETCTNLHKYLLDQGKFILYFQQFSLLLLQMQSHSLLLHSSLRKLTFLIVLFGGTPKPAEKF